MSLTGQQRRLLDRLGDARGFTIVELMAVLVILGLIIGLVSQAVLPRVDKARQDTAVTQMEIIGLALDNYRLDVGVYPDSLEALVTSTGEGWRGPYLRKEKVPLDPWKEAYIYEVTEGGADYGLSSNGGGKERIVAR